MDANSPNFVSGVVPDVPKSPVAKSINGVLNAPLSTPKEVNDAMFFARLNSVDQATNYKPVLNTMGNMKDIPLLSGYSVDYSVGLDYGNLSNATDPTRIIRGGLPQFPP